jgi:hypothetical protein
MDLRNSRHQSYDNEIEHHLDRDKYASGLNLRRAVTESNSRKDGRGEVHGVIVGLRLRLGHRYDTHEQAGGLRLLTGPPLHVLR